MGMITQKLLDDIKSYEEYFFPLLRVPLPSSGKDGAGKNKGGANETPLKPEQVDKIVKQALNRLKVKQDLVKKRSSSLTAEAAKAAKGAAAKGKRKAGETDEDGGVVKSKKK